MQNTHRSGFQMSELIVVSAALVLLAGIVIPVVSRPNRKPHNSRVSADLDSVARAFTAYHVDTGVWPANGTFDPDVDLDGELTHLPCLYRNVHELSGWGGPYLSTGYRKDQTTTYIAIPGTGVGGGLRDPWGRNYLLYYVSKAAADGNGAILILSRGPDGKLNTPEVNLRFGVSNGDDLALRVTRTL
jgi:hypothetical protein